MGKGFSAAPGPRIPCPAESKGRQTRSPCVNRAKPAAKATTHTHAPGTARTGLGGRGGDGIAVAAAAAPVQRPQPRPHTRRPLGPAPGLLRPPPRKAARVRLSLPQFVLPTTPLLTTGLRLSTRTPDFDARVRPRRQTQKPLRATAGVGRQREGDKVLGKLKESPEAMSSALPATVGRRGQISQPSVAGAELRE